MASQTDKKEEFRRYLEKSNVLATLTNILTDLFEMETRPDDPGRYLYQKFGESLGKSLTSPSQPKNNDQTVKRGDAPANHVVPTTTTETIGSSQPIQNPPLLESTPNKDDIVMAESPNNADQTVTTNIQTQGSRPEETHGQEGQVSFLNAHTSALPAKENAESSVAANSLGESAQPASTAALGQPPNLATLPVGSSGQNNGEHMTRNTSGLPLSPTSAQ